MSDDREPETAGAEASTGPSVDEDEASERLDRRLERGAVEVDEVVALARTLAVHLDAEHAAGRTDGALEPARISMAHPNVPRLLPAGDKAKSPRAYTAPEAWQGTPTRSSDQFSMAAILYEALCGGRAFPGDDTARIRVSVTKGSRIPLAARVPGLAEAVDDVLSRALALEPEARFPSCSVFADELITAIERSRPSSEGVLVKKPSNRTAARRNPLLLDDMADEDQPPIPWLKVIVGLVLLAIVAGVLAYNGGH